MLKIFVLGFTSLEGSRDFYFVAPDSVTGHQFYQLIKESFHRHVFRIAKDYLRQEAGGYDWVILETILDDLIDNIIKDLAKYGIEPLKINYQVVGKLWAIIRPYEK